MVKLTGNETFVYNSYRRLLQMFGSVVLGIPDEPFEEAIEHRKKQKSVKDDTELTAEDWKALAEEFKAIIRQHKGFDFPQDPIEQIRLATDAVFRSWNGKRAVDYRRAEKIPDDLGTAVNIVTMVFGNMGWDSGTGVAFTRDPATGERVMYGDYLMNAQGEDVVAGIRNTKRIVELGHDMPDAYAQFLDICSKLERHYRDMQDTEFTIERGRLWMLQTRNGKRTAKAAIRIAVSVLLQCEQLGKNLLLADKIHELAVPYLFVVIIKESGLAHLLEESDGLVHDRPGPFIRHETLVLFRLDQIIHFTLLYDITRLLNRLLSP
jgi:pyruvate,orthophosphate dikinase